jgi:hypothetical protein
MLAHNRNQLHPHIRFETLLRTFLAVLVLGSVASQGIAQTTQTTTLTISNQNGTVISGLTISTTSGPCISISNSTGITIQNSNIGPCGDNNSTNNSQGIYISGNSSVNIYDNYIHVENQSSVCGDSHDNIQIKNNGSTPVNIQGNVIAYGESNIHVWDASNISVIGNFLLNPRGATSCGNPDNLQGNQFHAWADDATPNANITVSGNYTLVAPAGYLYPGTGSDEIGFGVTNGFIAQNNWVQGATNPTACGIIADYKANSGQIIGNVINETYNCGVGIASGTNHVVSGNKVLITNGTGSATGVTVNGGYSPIACGTVTLSYNYAYAHQSNGWVQGYYNNGYCTGVTLTGNTFDVGCTAPSCTAYSALYQLPATNPPPLIPPQPYACVASSPYSTQTSKPLCSTGSPPPPPPTSPPPPAPTASMAANPMSITSGQSSTLSWSSTNSTSCGGSGFTASGTSGSVVVAPPKSTTYGVTCSGNGGSASASVQVSVAAKQKGRWH